MLRGGGSLRTNNPNASGALGNTKRERQFESALDSAAAEPATKKLASQLTLAKRIKYAQWTIAPIVFRLGEVLISVVAMALASAKLNIVMVIVTGFTGPLIMNAILTHCVERRFKAFDADYPSFLLSVVGLLKTGMNAMGALEASAQGMAEGSLLRMEIEMMVERLRFGVPEDKSIGAFAEDIYHPEIELFVQALLLSRRVGGTLSDTLDRLAKQVRKRQYFRSSAVAAVGLQRGSIWFIVSILAGLEVYLYFIFPEAVVGAWKDPIGWNVWQSGLLLIVIGMVWVRQVTKLKV